MLYRKKGQLRTRMRVSFRPKHNGKVDSYELKF